MTTHSSPPTLPSTEAGQSHPSPCTAVQAYADAWLPVDFDHPTRVAVTRHHHLRPIRATDVDLDLPAVTGSRERLYSIYGQAWSWPPLGMTREQDVSDLAHHEQEIREHRSFNYALFDEPETVLLGCVYLDPATRAGFDVEVSWWVIDDQLGTDLQIALDALVPTWVSVRWPFAAPAYLGRDITWSDYLALPTRRC